MAAPYATPPPLPRQRRRGGVVWPIVLIFIGAVFLLQNMGFLPPNFWMNLWRLWPMVLVLAGIELLLAHRVPWLALVGLAAAMLVLGGFAARSRLASPAPAASSTSSSGSTSLTELQGASQATVTVRFGAGQLSIEPLDQLHPNVLASLTYDGPPELAPTPRYTVVGGVGQLQYQGSGHGGTGLIPFVDGHDAGSSHANVKLTPTVPINSLTVQAGAADAHVDLSTLQVANIDMSIGAATAWIRFPEAAGNTIAHLSGGASSITLEVPQGVAAQIRQRGGLNTVKIDQSRFPQVGEGLYRSANYETEQNKLDITVETGVTTLTVN